MVSWQDIINRLAQDQELERAGDIKDIVEEHSYSFFKSLSLSAVLDKNPSSRERSINLLNVSFGNIVRKGYVEDGSVYLGIKGGDGKLKSFFVGDVSEYAKPSASPVPFDLDSN